MAAARPFQTDGALLSSSRASTAWGRIAFGWLSRSARVLMVLSFKRNRDESRSPLDTDLTCVTRQLHSGQIQSQTTQSRILLQWFSNSPRTFLDDSCTSAHLLRPVW